MGRPAIPVTTRACGHCQMPMERKRFGPLSVLESRLNYSRRLYCDQTCMANAMMGKIKVLTPQNSRRQSGRAASAQCERCQRPKAETRLYVHHRDLNPLNNEPSNLETLCGACHRRLHTPNRDSTTGQLLPCKLCSRPSERNRLCGMHRRRLKLYGDPCLTKRKCGSSWTLIRDSGSA